MVVSIPGCEIIKGGPDRDPDRGVPAVLVRFIEEDAFYFYYPSTNGFGNSIRATQIAKQIQLQRADKDT